MEERYTGSNMNGKMLLDSDRHCAEQLPQNQEKIEGLPVFGGVRSNDFVIRESKDDRIPDDKESFIPNSCKISRTWK